MIQSSFFNKKLKQMWYIGFVFKDNIEIHDYIRNFNLLKQIETNVGIA